MRLAILALALAPLTVTAAEPARVLISTKAEPAVSFVAVGAKVSSSVTLKINDTLTLDVKTDQKPTDVPLLLVNRRLELMRKLATDAEKPGADPKALRERFEADVAANDHLLADGTLGKVSDGFATFTGKLRVHDTAVEKAVPRGKVLVEGEAAESDVPAIRNGDGVILVTGPAAKGLKGRVRVVGVLTLGKADQPTIEAESVGETGK